MASGPRIEITVNPRGETRTQVFGITGDGCKVASAEYEMLFGDVLEHTATAEAYEDPEQVEIKNQQK
jgi:hypothetical protein